MKPEFKQISPLICEFEWDSNITDQLLQQQVSFTATLKKEFSSVILETRMGFKTLTLLLSKPIEPFIIEDWLRTLSQENLSEKLPEKIWQIPVCYSRETGRDLETLAEAKDMDLEELIVVHSTPLYRLHFYGFLPGFMYLNGLPKELSTARKSIPDMIIPAGSVAIGGSQTGIYPSSSPGGWHLIGQTPISLFDPGQSIPVFALAGERIEFVPITNQQFDRMLRHPSKPNYR